MWILGFLSLLFFVAFVLFFHLRPYRLLAISLVCLLLLLLCSCATTAEKELRKHCQTAVADMRCPKPKPPRDTKDLVEYCVHHGGVKRKDDCVWITRDELQDILRQIQRGY